jgi:hypothetical protein
MTATDTEIARQKIFAIDYVEKSLSYRKSVRVL